MGNKLKYFTTRLTPEVKRAVVAYAKKQGVAIYTAVENLIKAGLGI